MSNGYDRVIACGEAVTVRGLVTPLGPRLKLGVDGIAQPIVLDKNLLELREMIDEMLGGPEVTEKIENTRGPALKTCEHCDGKFFFLVNSNGKYVPVDANTVDPRDTVFSPRKHVLHFDTCPHRKGLKTLPAGPSPISFHCGVNVLPGLTLTPATLEKLVAYNFKTYGDLWARTEFLVDIKGLPAKTLREIMTYVEIHGDPLEERDGYEPAQEPLAATAVAPPADGGAGGGGDVRDRRAPITPTPGIPLNTDHEDEEPPF